MLITQTPFSFHPGGFSCSDAVSAAHAPVSYTHLVADVVHIKDQDGTLYNEYVTARKFYNYKPADILSHIDEKYTSTQTPLYIELTQLLEVYKRQG